MTENTANEKYGWLYLMSKMSRYITVLNLEIMPNFISRKCCISPHLVLQKVVRISNRQKYVSHSVTSTFPEKNSEFTFSVYGEFICQFVWNSIQPNLSTKRSRFLRALHKSKIWKFYFGLKMKFYYTNGTLETH